ncbi:leucine-rich repeat receptor-like serine/threonine-protein kinase RGI4 [Panicum virgatum]|uniref:leucine-rich repeat receptor-like serine/threonine-protein kinase RGI4 n=1 Tax=Panicum virgatum TaxID=38727 RepID=UPI0019D5E133|nr:leucine-rich repeat receptor-like serine/threonine-protein kinase RGI4 [Panicum virgatum]
MAGWACCLLMLPVLTSGAAAQSRSASASAAGAPCSWPNVACDSAAGRVTKLYLDNLNITGPIVDAVGGLSSLEHLHLSNNISGVLPTALYRCRSLRFLDLSINNIGGKLPDDLGNRLGRNLRTLYFGANRFDGSVLVSLCMLRNLRYLGLSECNFTGTVPAELGQLTKLKEFSDVQVEILDLSDNSFTGTIPAGIWRLPNLKEFMVYNNSFTGNLQVDGFPATG